MKKLINRLLGIDEMVEFMYISKKEVEDTLHKYGVTKYKILGAVEERKTVVMLRATRGTILSILIDLNGEFVR